MRNERSRIHKLYGVLRNLDGISYEVLEDPEKIREFVNSEAREEWEQDNRRRGRDPSESKWLASLLSRNWRLALLHLEEIRLNPEILSIKNEEYDLQQSVQERKEKFKRAIATAAPFPPVIVRQENMHLMDGYGRVATLRDLSVARAYAYMG